MKIVTGANGFIGSVLAKDLNLSGYDDLILSDYIDLETRPQLLANTQYKDFVHPDQLLQNLSDYKEVESIFHIGACSDTTETRWGYLENVNLNYTKSLFQFCAENNIPFYYASSAAVYGDGQNGFDDSKDSSLYSSLNLYGKSKLDFDQWAMKQESKPPRWFGFRFFNVFGPNEYFKNNMASVAFKAVEQIQRTNRLKLFKSHNPKYKDGEQVRDFVYVKDVTRWIIEYSKNKNIENGIYNLGFGSGKTWLNLASSIFHSLEVPTNIEWIDIPESIRDQYQYFTEANMSKHQQQGLSLPQWPLELAISDYVKNYLANDNLVY